MKKTIPVTLALAVAAMTTVAHGGEQPARVASTTAAAALGEEHRRLAELSGLWNVRQSLWMTGENPPQVDSGTAVFTPVLAGRYLQQDLRVSSSAPFQGIGYLGYDNLSRSYFTTWMDVNLTDVLLLRGDYDAATRTYRFSGQMSADGGRKVATREELRILDKDHFVARYFETRQGSEALVVELAYSRP